jgi:hypothetical protein
MTECEKWLRYEAHHAEPTRPLEGLGEAGPPRIESGAEAVEGFGNLCSSTYESFAPAGTPAALDRVIPWRTVYVKLPVVPACVSVLLGCRRELACA